MDYQPTTPLELLLAMLLSPQHHWLVTLFRECSALLWTMLPTFIALLVFSMFKEYRSSRRIEDLFAQALADPRHPLHHTIQLHIKKATHIDEQHAMVDRVHAKISNLTTSHGGKLFAVEGELSDMKNDLSNVKVKPSVVEERNATNEGKVASLEQQLSKIQREVLDELPQIIRDQVAKNIHTEARKVIKDADNARVLLLAHTTTNPDHELLWRLRDQVFEQDVQLRDLAKVSTKAKGPMTEIQDRIEQLEAAISKQDMIIRSLTSAQNVTAAAVTNTKVLSGLQSRVDDHDMQLHKIAQISADVDGLDARMKTFSKSSGQQETIMSTISAMEGKLYVCDTQLTSIDTLMEQYETLDGKIEEVENRTGRHQTQLTNINTLTKQLEGRIEESEKKIGTEVSNEEHIVRLQSMVESFEAYLADLHGVSKQIASLDGRTNALETKLAPQSKLCKQLDTTETNLVDLSTRTENCEARITDLHMKGNRDADKVTEELTRLRGWEESGAADIDWLTERIDNCEGNIEQLQHITGHPDSDMSTSDESNNAADTTPPAKASSLKGLPNPSSAPKESGQEGANASKASSPVGVASDPPLPAPVAAAVQTPSAFTQRFNPGEHLNQEIDFSAPESDSPISFLGDGTGGSSRRDPEPVSSPYTSNPFVARLSTSNSPPHMSLSNSGVPSYAPHLSLGTSELISPASPVDERTRDEEMKDIGPVYDETGIPESGEGLEELMMFGGFERPDDDAEMGSVDDAEGDHDDNDAPFGTGW